MIPYIYDEPSAVGAVTISFFGGKASDSIILVVVSLLVVSLFVAGHALYERVVYVFLQSSAPTNRGRILFKGIGERKVVALTFNLMVSSNRVDDLIDILDEESVQSTFFINGTWGVVHRKTVERLREKGHVLGNLGWSYTDYSQHSRSFVKHELRQTQRELSLGEAGNRKLFRPPMGLYDAEVMRAAASCGYSTVLADVDVCKMRARSSPSLVKRLVEQVNHGSIISFSLRRSCQHTLEVFPALIDELRKRGYSFLTLNELLAGNMIR